MLTYIYTVESIDTTQETFDFSLLSLCSSMQSAIKFIKSAIEDENSRVESYTIIQITKESIDEYFGETKFIGRMDAEEWTRWHE